MEQETCLRCGHKWYKRNPEIPKVCPKCKTPYWDRPRKEPKALKEILS